MPSENPATTNSANAHSKASLRMNPRIGAINAMRINEIAFGNQLSDIRAIASGAVEEIERQRSFAHAAMVIHEILLENVLLNQSTQT